MSSGGGGSSFSSPSAGAASSPSISFGDRATREFAPRHRDGFSSGLAYNASDDGQKGTPRSIRSERRQQRHGRHPRRRIVLRLELVQRRIGSAVG
jgi:hypothetical protein